MLKFFIVLAVAAVGLVIARPLLRAGAGMNPIGCAIFGFFGTAMIILLVLLLLKQN